MYKRIIGFTLLAALLVAGCRTTGRTITQDFAADYPDTDPANVVLEIATGTLNLTATDASGISGTATTNVENWAVTTTTEPDGTVRIQQGAARTEVIPNATNQWDVRMERGRAVNLTIATASAGGNLDLGGLSLPQLAITGSTGPYQLNYTTRAASTGGRISVALTGGALNMTNVLNSGAAAITTATTSGVQTLEFTGTELLTDMRVSVTASAADVILRIPAQIPTRIVFNTTSGSVRDMPEAFERRSQSAFENAEYASADAGQPRLLIEVVTVVGGLRVFELAPL